MLGTVLLIAAAAPLCAQVVPTPGTEDPRLQTLVQPEGQRARLVVFPDAALTLIMRQGERIQRAVVTDSAAFNIALTGSNDSVSIRPRREGAVAGLSVYTNTGRHEFDLETGRGLAAAYVVRMIASVEPEQQESRPDMQPDLASMTGRYRLKGDRSLRPETITDDGSKTYIDWGRGQSIPAVLGIGASGAEEVVPGYMRHGLFTIDRVYPELVFRIDRQQTKATRETEGRRR